MLDVAEVLVRQGVNYAVIDAMAAAAHGVVRASLDADALVMLQVREAASLRRSFDAAGFITELRVGDPDDPIPALLAVRDTHGNRVDVLVGLRGLDPDALARAALELDHDTLDLELLRRLSARFGRGADVALEMLLAE